LDQLLLHKMYTCPYCKSRQSINLDAQQETALRYQARQMMNSSAAAAARQQQQAAVMQRHQQAVAAAAAYQQLVASAGGGAAPRPAGAPGAPQVSVWSGSWGSRIPLCGVAFQPRSAPARWPTPCLEASMPQCVLCRPRCRLL
jgi:hypothetical protein